MNTRSRSCPVSDEMLLAFRDGELTAGEHARHAAHIDNCSACQARLGAATTMTDQLLAATPLRDDPVRRAAIHATNTRRRGAWWLAPALRGATLAVAMVLLVVVGLRWWDGRLCPNCDVPTGPNNAAITQIAGLPAHLASPALVCAAPNAAVAWQQQTGRVAYQNQLTAKQPGAVPGQMPGTGGDVRLNTRPGAPGQAMPGQMLASGPNGQLPGQAPTGGCTPVTTRFGVPQVAQTGLSRPGN